MYCLHFFYKKKIDSYENVVLELNEIGFIFDTD
jgi:hypothetical protein